MQVYIVRSAMPGCEPTCAEWIAAQGRIEAGSVARFKKVLRDMGSRRLPVLIDSTGGTVEHGLAIGRLIRSRQLDVAVSKTDLVRVPCDPDDAQCRKRLAAGGMKGTVNVALSKCASACVFVLASGTRRTVSDRTWVGVHQFTSYRTKVLRTYRYEPAPAWDSPGRRRRILVSEKVISGKNVPTPRRDKVYGVVKKYFAEMGIGDGIMELLFSAPSTSIRWLSAGELTTTLIATDLMPVDTVIMEKAPDVPPDLIGPPEVQAGSTPESASATKNAAPGEAGVAPSSAAPETDEQQPRSSGSPEL